MTQVSSDNVVVIAQRNDRERDRLYTILTSDDIVRTVRGTGARKHGAKIAPHMEPLLYTHIMVARNRGRGVVTFALCEESFSALRTQVSLFTTARSLLLAVERLTRDNMTVPRLFSLIYVSLHSANNIVERTRCIGGADTILLWAMFHTLALLGWPLSVSRQCVQCADAAPTHCVFDVAALWCGRCATRARHAQAISRDVAALLHIFATHTPHATHPATLAKVTVPASVRRETRRLLLSRIRYVAA